MPVIHHEVTFDAPAARVYRALMNSAEHAQFTGLPADIGTTEGDAFSLCGGRITGHHVELVPDRRIVQAWRGAHWPDDVFSTVRIELRADGNTTRLLLEHDAVPEAHTALVDRHWRSRYWQALTYYFEPWEPRATALAPHIRQQYPWPDDLGAAIPYVVDIDGGGRFLVDRLIARQHKSTLLEIGAFLGGSTLRWLRVSPTVDVVAVDPWLDGIAADFVAQDVAWRNWPAPSDDVLRTLQAKDGLYHTFLANLAPHKDRVVPVRGRSEQVLDQLAADGLVPDVIYIDADKKRSDLDDCFRLWPTAQLCGDDYLWAPERGYPMQQHVHAFAAEHGYTVRHVLHTWVLVPAASA